jgi:quercetin 2,3-dioxygenase
MVTTQDGMEIRRADDRGHTSIGWLESRHSFAFGSYRDPARMGFRSLRVLNDDIVAPGGGFAEHGHKEMEIISWILDGALEHQDSSGNRGVIEPGDVQLMTAGRGIRHREMNASSSKPVHFLQIWIEPDQANLDPGYQCRAFDLEGRRSQWQVVASHDGRENSLTIHQSALLLIAEVTRGHQLDSPTRIFEHGYLHVASGAVRLNDIELSAGDAIAFSSVVFREIEAREDSQLLFFDLA